MEPLLPKARPFGPSELRFNVVKREGVEATGVRRHSDQHRR